MKTNNFNKWRILDWSAALASLGYGVYDHLNLWFLAGGLLGLLMAWWNPAEKMTAHIRSKFSYKRVGSANDDSLKDIPAPPTGPVKRDVAANTEAERLSQPVAAQTEHYSFSNPGIWA